VATGAGIQETVLIHPSTGGRPQARRMPTETNPDQAQLIDIFNANWTLRRRWWFRCH
jgi:hypothetical protein